ncbi:uroporphyrinogen decarboxylase family protein [Candidatus Latescibacterota bacterium]
MRGRDIALATLMREPVAEPCINFCWMTNSSYLSSAAGRDFWSDREGVFYEYLHHCGINLVPQWYFPGESQRNLEKGRIMHDVRPGGTAAILDPDDILRSIDQLPSDAQTETAFDHGAAALAYADDLRARTEKSGDEVLFIGSFGQADFMGGFSRWGYEHYLTAIADHPEALRRYYHHTALRGRLLNEAIVLAHQKHGIAPFAYSGQDICGSGGPMVSPALLRQIYFPELRWCLEPLVDNGIDVIWHCDGNICPILDDIMSLGVAGLQGFEEEHGVSLPAMAALRDRRGRPISVWGCVSVTSTLPHGTPQDVRRAVERSFQVAGPDRGFVLSSTSSILPEVPHENIDALFEHGRTFGRDFLSG